MGNDEQPNAGEENPSSEDIAHAINILRAAGSYIQFQGETQLPYLSVNEVARCLSVHPKWVRAHLDEFPNSFTLDGRTIRIPRSDLEAALERWRIKK